MEESLRQKTLWALSWSFLESIGLQGIRFLIGIVLARILFPEQFGLIAILTFFIAVAQSFLDCGFGAALIQKPEVTKTDISTIFFFNIVVGFSASGILCLLAPWIAAFYDQPVLTTLTMALSLVIVINSFGLIQNTLLTKQINFRTQTKISLIAGILSGILGVILAVIGFGVWSLVIQQISSAFFRTFFLWVFNDWRPAMIFSFKSLQNMFAFGSRLLASDILNQVFNNVYLLVIGKVFSPADLGIFTRAQTLADFPSQTLSGLVYRVTFPVFSSIQEDRARLKRGLKKALTAVVLVNFPMMIGLILVAPSLVIVILTEKWAPCIPYLQLLSFAGLLYPIHVLNLNVLTSLGRSDLFLRIEIIKKALILINIIVTLQWGISAMIYGMIVISIISYLLNSYYTGVLISYTFLEQLQDIYFYFIMAVCMGGVVYAAGLLPFPNHWSLLFVQIALGSIVYIFLCRLFRLSAFMELWDASWNRISYMNVV